MALANCLIGNAISHARKSLQVCQAEREGARERKKADEREERREGGRGSAGTSNAHLVIRSVAISTKGIKHNYN